MSKSDSRIACIFVGVQSRGELMVRMFQEADGRFRPVAFVDANQAIAKAQREKLNLNDVPCFDRLEEACDAVQADACVITSPARFHTQQIRQALQAGLHVFVAKPMTYDLDEAAELVKLAESRFLSLVVDQQARFCATERAMRRMVIDKQFGEVGLVSFIIHRHRPTMRAFTGDHPFIWEQGVHSFNSLLAILDRPAVSVLAVESRPPWCAYNGPTTATGVIDFQGGVPCTYLGTFESRNNFSEIRLDCDRAVLRNIGSMGHPSHLYKADPGGEFEPMGIDDTQDTRRLEFNNIDSFHEAITTGRRVENDGRDNLRTLAIVDAFIRSAQSGRRELIRAFD